MEVPSEGMGGGLKAKMVASLMPMNMPMRRPPRALALWFGLGRSFQSFKVMKERPIFCP